MIATGAAQQGFSTPPFLPTPGGIVNVIPSPVQSFAYAPLSAQQGQQPPDYATIQAFARNGNDASNFFTDICPTCGNVHHLYSLAPYICHSGKTATAGWPGTVYTPVVPNDCDLPSGDLVWLAYGFNIFLGVGSDYCTYSWDAQTWYHSNIPKSEWQTVVVGADKFVVGGYDQWHNGIIATSPDGQNWTRRTLPTGSGDIQYLIWTGAQYVGIGQGIGGSTSAGTCVTSPDGITWTARTMPAGWWGGIAYNGTNLYVAIDYNGLCATSPDAVTWTSRTGLYDGKRSPQDISYGNGVFCIVGLNTTCATSTDGITWTDRADAGGNYVAVRWDGAQFVSVGNNSAMTSPNGTTWTARTLPNGYYVDMDFATSPSKYYCAVGFQGAAARSYDGQTWVTNTVVGGWEILHAGKIIES